MRFVLMTATAIAIALGVSLSALEAAPVSRTAPAGAYSAEQPNVIPVRKRRYKRGGKYRRAKRHRRRHHRRRHHRRSRRVIIERNYYDDRGSDAGALIGALIIGGMTAAIINDAVED